MFSSFAPTPFLFKGIINKNDRNNNNNNKWFLTGKALVKSTRSPPSKSSEQKKIFFLRWRDVSKENWGREQRWVEAMLPDYKHKIKWCCSNGGAWLNGWHNQDKVSLLTLPGSFWALNDHEQLLRGVRKRSFISANTIIDSPRSIIIQSQKWSCACCTQVENVGDDVFERS